ncbi:MAG TPA: hypothetical protein VHL58_01230 [Thermoanaerobaculia bacterium]|nr:hypothetical protein [Thermoanaerobaculia bacterium]
MTKRRVPADVYAILLLCLVCAIPFLDVLLSSSRFYIRDLTRYYFPTKSIIREVLLGGDFPYWNRFYSGGQPMAANPEYEIFYPLQWLILLPSYDFGFRLHILVHVYIAAVGMYLLLRSMSLRVESAFFGAIVFAIGGVFVSMINLLPILFCIAWLPLILLFVRRYLLLRRVGDLCLAGFFLGVEGLVGEPTSILQTWFLIASYMLYRLCRDRDVKTFLRCSAASFVMVIAQVCGGAAQLIPAVDHARDSARARMFDFDLVTSWSMPYARPLELFVPNLFGHIFKNGTYYWGSGMYPSVSSPFIFSIYLGMIAAVLIAAGLCIRQRGRGIFLFVAGVSTILALGGHTPLFQWLYDLGIGSIRYPEKFAFMGLFASIIFAAITFDRLLDEDGKARDVAATVAVILTVLFGAIAAFSFTPQYAIVFAKLWKLTPSPATSLMIRMSATDWLLTTARASGAAILLILASTKRRTLWFSVLVLATVVDLTPLDFEVLPRFPKKFFTPPEVTGKLDHKHRFDSRIFHEPDWYGSAPEAKSFFGTGQDVYWVVRNGLFPMTTASWGFQTVLERDYDKTALLSTVDFTDAMWRVRDTKSQPQWAELFMSMSNVGYRGVYRPFEVEKKRIHGDFKKSMPVTFLPIAVTPRYYLADQFVQVRDQNDFVNRMSKGRWSLRVAAVSFPPFAPSKGTVDEVTEGPNSATIKVSSEDTNFLVMSVTTHKYWKATLDGRPVPLRVANIGYQGVMIPRGRHVVKMRYRNDLVPPMVVLSILTGALLLSGGIAFGGFRREAT